MHCYQTLAATLMVARSIDEIPGVRHHLPLSVIADWMAENDLEPEELLRVSADEVRAVVENLILSNRPGIAHAA